GIRVVAAVSAACLKHVVSLRPVFSRETGENIFLAREKVGKPPQRQRTLRFGFVQNIERIFQWHTPDAAEPGLLAKLAHLRFMEPERAQPCTMVRQRGGHAIKHAYAVKHRAERIRILLELV